VLRWTTRSWGIRLESKDMSAHADGQETSSGDRVLMHARYDKDGVYLSASEGAKALLGYDPSELVGTSAYAYFHPEDFAIIAAAHARVLGLPDSTTATYRRRHRDGDHNVDKTGRAGNQTWSATTCPHPGAYGGTRCPAVGRFPRRGSCGLFQHACWKSVVSAPPIIGPGWPAAVALSRPLCVPPAGVLVQDIGMGCLASSEWCDHLHNPAEGRSEQRPPSRHPRPRPPRQDRQGRQRHAARRQPTPAHRRRTNLRPNRRHPARPGPPRHRRERRHRRDPARPHHRPTQGLPAHGQATRPPKEVDRTCELQVRSIPMS
jgi:hypothetical protein